MKHLLYILIAALLLVGCSSKPSKKAPSNEPAKWDHYTGPWFEFDYPSFMQIAEERNEISDTIPGLKEGGDVYVYGDYLPYRFRLTKSAMFEVFDNPEQWRDLSIESKFGRYSSESESYLGVYETQDSLSFNGHPAASVTYAVLADNDTIVHHQLVVLAKPSMELYYLNFLAPLDDYGNHDALVDSVFNSIVLK